MAQPKSAIHASIAARTLLRYRNMVAGNKTLDEKGRQKWMEEYAAGAVKVLRDAKQQGAGISRNLLQALFKDLRQREDMRQLLEEAP